jgi:hypothetical protein
VQGALRLHSGADEMLCRWPLLPTPAVPAVIDVHGKESVVNVSQLAICQEKRRITRDRLIEEISRLKEFSLKPGTRGCGDKERLRPIVEKDRGNVGRWRARQWPLFRW